MPTRNLPAEGTNVFYYLDDWYGGSVQNDYIPMSTIAKEPLASDTYRHYSPISSSDVCFKFLRVPMKWTGNIEFKGTGAYCGLVLRTKDGRDVIKFLNVNGDDNPSRGYSIPHTVDVVSLTDGSELGATSSVDVDSIIGFMYYKNYNVFPNAVDGFIPDSWNVFTDSTYQDTYWCDIDGTQVPYYSKDNPDGKRISALPFRAFQSIYNALIRNAENNPFYIDGVPEYNKYIVSDAGGASSDGDEMVERYANWSDDRFTTALPSPQQGNAPLVGLTGTAPAVLTIGNEDGSVSTVKLEVDTDTGYVVAVDAAASTASEDNISEAWNAVDYGISINDLRNVNAYQRWKENNIRRGYKYKDQISAHYGVSVRYEVLDMPEFIGGVSRDISVSQITQTVQNSEGNLGDIAGQSYIMGEGKSISQFCDEHGYIIGILDVKPMPLYQDCLPKHFLVNDAFDYYFPEFGHIGPQPIKNQEIAFSQSVALGVDENTFGYQRAWYDLLERLDEVHGLFRSDFRNFLLARDFASVPELGSSFLTVNSEDINNTFYSDDTNDKILGQLYFDVKMKRPIPLYGIPSIE